MRVTLVVDTKPGKDDTKYLLANKPKVEETLPDMTAQANRP